MRVIVVPSPSWPLSLEPQHLRSALAVTYAHVWKFPSSSSPTAPPTLIVVGVARLVVVPSPRWPLSFQPQHLRSVLAVTYAHVWTYPSASSPTAPPTLIVVGVARLVVVPSPSWP